MGLALCNCRQTRSTGVGISPGPSRCKDGGRGVVMMGVDIREGVMLGVNMRREVPTEGCLIVAGSMLCRSREKRVEIRIPQVTLPLLMNTFNHEWNQVKFSDVWAQWTGVKRRIGAANCSKKLIKNREVETLPAGSGGTGNVPTVSGSWAKNGVPWTLGWVSSRICTGNRREQEVMKQNWQDGRVSKYLSCALCFKLNKQISRPFIKYDLKDRKDKTQSMKVTNCARSR